MIFFFGRFSALRSRDLVMESLETATTSSMDMTTQWEEYYLTNGMWRLCPIPKVINDITLPRYTSSCYGQYLWRLCPIPKIINDIKLQLCKKLLGTMWRAFGVLQSCWSIVCGAAVMYDSKTLWEVMTHCVILHNMIIENKHDEAAHTNDFEKFREHIRPRTRCRACC